jgi:ribonuclease J
MVQLTVFDGAETIGGNKILLEDGGVCIFFDFGINFHLRNQYFEEYLVPRSRRGLLDMFPTGLLPPIRGIYRDDLQVPDIDVWKRTRAPYPIRQIELAGVLLSHAHLDHSGHISFLRQDIPIVSSLCTALLAKAIQDCSRPDFEREVCYLIPKVEVKKGVAAGALLESGEYRNYPAQQRPFRVCDCEPTAKGAEFWRRAPASREIVPQDLYKVQEIGGLSIEAFPVDHSVLGATAFAVRTSQGWVIYTGELRAHGKLSELTREFAEAARKLEPLVLICEGTQVETERAIDEGTVQAKALETIRPCQTLVIADFGARNLERLLTFRQIAKECQRRLVVTSKDIYLLEAASLATEMVIPPDQDEVLMLYRETKKLEGWEKSVFDRYRDRSVDPKELRANGADYILCFSYWDINELVEIDPEPGALYLYSSSEAFDEEQRFDILRLRNWLSLFGMQPVGLPDAQTGKVLEAERGLHASGHIAGPHLLDIIRTINPQFVVPVHTESLEFFRRNIEPNRLRLPEKGNPMSF